MLRVVRDEEELRLSPFDEVTITAQEYSLLRGQLGMAILDLEEEDSNQLAELRGLMEKLGGKTPSRIHITFGTQGKQALYPQDDTNC